MVHKLTLIIIIHCAFFITEALFNAFDTGSGDGRSLYENLHQESQVRPDRMTDTYENLQNILMDNLDTNFYDIRSNETGRFDGQATGQWNRFGYTTWLVSGNSANISGYTIEKYDVKQGNLTFLEATYIQANATAGKYGIQWSKTYNSRLMLRNGTLTTLSNSIGKGNGRMDLMSNNSVHFKEDDMLTVNRTNDQKIVTWQLKKNGIVNVFKKYISFLGFVNGVRHFTTKGDKYELPLSDELNNILKEKHNVFNDHSEWSSQTTCFVTGQGKVKKFNMTSSMTYDQESFDSTVQESRNSSGFIWDNVQSLGMDLPGSFNEVLPTIFRLLF